MLTQKSFIKSLFVDIFKYNYGLSYGLTQHLVLSTARANYENDGVEGRGWSAKR